MQKFSCIINTAKYTYFYFLSIHDLKVDSSSKSSKKKKIGIASKTAVRITRLEWFELPPTQTLAQVV